MRFKSSLSSVVLLASAVYVLHLGISRDLDLYIHPRYIVFTMVLSLLVLCIVSIHVIGNTETTNQRSSLLSYIPLVVILAAALLVPARSLTSATVSQRKIDSGSIVSTESSKPLNMLFSGSSRGLEISDWSRLLATNTDPNYYANKPAKVSGFIYDAQLGSDTVWLARFVLTCCAVDAQPIGVPISIKDWEASYEEDQWIEAEGEFTIHQTQAGEQLVLSPTSITSIEQPENPYAN